MTIRDHLTLDSDLKLGPPPERLDETQRKAWEAAYGPKREAFRKAGLSGQALVRWKYQRYLEDYLGCVAAIDEGIGRILTGSTRPGWPGIPLSSTRPTRGSSWASTAGSTSASCTRKRSGCRSSCAFPGYPGRICEQGHAHERRFCPDLSRLCRLEKARGHAGEVVSAAGRAGRSRLARVGLLPLLRIPGRPHGQAPLWRPHRAIQAHPFLP